LNQGEHVPTKAKRPFTTAKQTLTAAKSTLTGFWTFSRRFVRFRYCLRQFACCLKHFASTIIFISIINFKSFFTMNRTKLSVAEFLHQCRLRVINSLEDDAIQEAVELLGYTPERLETGKVLLDESTQLSDTFTREHGEVEAAFARRDAEREKANATYRKHLTIARIVFKKDRGAQTSLQLNGRVATTLSGWLKQTKSFYNNLMGHESWMGLMAGYNITTEMLTQGRQEILNVENYADVIMREKGDAQNATQERDQKLEELAEWINDYESVARVALADTPQLLEKLGIVVKA